MRVVIAPDSFKESMTAAEAAGAIERGVRAALPSAECVLLPVADGGEGTLDALAAALAAEWHELATVDALGRPVRAAFGRSDRPRTRAAGGGRSRETGRAQSGVSAPAARLVIERWIPTFRPSGARLSRRGG